MTTLSKKKTISVDQVHTLIKDEVNTIMANARQTSEPLTRVHLEQTAKTLSRLYSKLTNDHGTGRQMLDQLAGKRPTTNPPLHTHGEFKTLDGNTPFKQISAQIRA